MRKAVLLVVVGLQLLVGVSRSQNLGPGKDTSRVLEIGIAANVPNAEALELATPIYPAQVRVTGDVTVRVVVDKSGAVIEVDVVSGNPLLRASTIEAARKSRFKVESSRTARNLIGTITYAFRFGEVGYEDLRFFVDQQVTLRGEFSLRGKIGPFVLVSGKPVYFASRGALDWNSTFGELEGKLVSVTGPIHFHRESVQTRPSDSVSAHLPDYFYFEVEQTKIEITQR